MTDAEIWEGRYHVTELKYARLYLGVAEQASADFNARIARAEAEAARASVAKEIADAEARGDHVTFIGGDGNRQG